ncbi:MAG TPA: CDP-alcohol phosphatidyltransferase family protein [Candidatus Aminicenantes bacterium]|nr:MAG: CDP-diacylglycerol--glycerol-3-phosphate 3-phosphatidyltransferase [Candidatus Aminicenantes bacterium]HEK86533.1 CDP-alcohol phosphatidyltransferase family protein [Candidatus Aminicenantes bacterium]
MTGTREPMGNSNHRVYELKSTFATLPNYLTLLRIILVPFFVAFLLKHKPVEAFLVFLLAGLTDLLDGLIARLWHQRSIAGLWLDPLADKLLLFSSFFLLSFPDYAFPNSIPWRVFWVVLIRDLLISAGAGILILLKKKKNFPPTLIGKTSTVCQVLTVIFVLFFNFINQPVSQLSWLYDLTIMATIISGLQYIWIGFRALISN